MSSSHRVIELRSATEQYDIYVGQGVLDQLGSQLADLLPGRKAFLFSHPQLLDLYGASVAATLSFSDLPQDPVYAGTKALVTHFTRSCAELAETHGVRVNAVLPGVVETPILAKTGDGKTPAGWLLPLLEHANIIEPAAVANCVLGLIRDDSAVGLCRVVDGDGERDVTMIPTENA